MRVYSGPSQISKIELFANIKNGLKPLPIFLNSSILDVLDEFIVIFEYVL